MHRRHNIQRHTRPRPLRVRRRRKGFAAGGLRRATGFVLATVVLAALALGAAHHRLRQGPVSLGPAEEWIEVRLSAGAEGLSFEIGEAVFALGEPGRPSGLRLRDVAVTGEDGRRLAAAPELDVDFHVLDLARGRLAPTRLHLDGARAEVVRDASGRLSFAGEGGGGGGALGFVALLDAAARGEGPLRRLTRISAQGAEIRLRDAASGRDWRLTEARFAVSRDGTGEVGRLVGLLRPGPGEGPPVRLALRGSRPGGAGPIRLGLRAADLPAGRLAGELARRALGAEAPAATPASAEAPARAEARAEAVLAPSGRLSELSATVELGEGRLPGAPAPFDAVSGGAAELAWSRSEGALEIARLELRGPAGRLTVSGRARPLGAQGAGPGAEGLALALRIEGLEIGTAAGLETPLVFEDGEILARLLRAPRRAELSSLRLVGPDLALRAEGAAASGPEGPELALRFESDGFTAETLKRGWPEQAAPKARDWVREHIRAGRVTDVSGALWAAPGRAPELAVDFGFAEVVAAPLDGMPAIEGARGEGRISLRRFDLTLAEGRVTPPGGEAITLAGSSFHAPDPAKDPPIGRPVIRAEGRIGDILSLLDEPPLELTRKIAAGGFAPSGRAEVRARLEFPMIKALQGEQVRLTAEADLSGVALALPGGGPALAAEALTLRADPRRLELTGPATLAGFPVRIAWTERFQAEGGAPRREVSARGSLPAEALAGLAPEGLRAGGGGAAGTLALSWAAPEAPARVRLDADLRDLALSAPGLGWRKARGAPGRLRVAGERRESGALRIDRMTVSAADLEAEGTASLAADGALDWLELSRLKLGDAADLSARLDTTPDGVRQVRIRGARLDLGALARRRQAAAQEAASAAEAATDAEAAPPIRADLAVETVQLADGVALQGAQGRLMREGGVTRAELTGAVNGGGPAQLRYRQEPDGGAVITLRSQDAGRLLADLGLSGAVKGGRLQARARLSPDSDGLSGVAELADIRVAERPALAAMVRRATEDGVIEAAPAGGEGFVFDRVEVPFVLEGDQLKVEGALASGIALGLKLDGSYDIASGELDLSGVLTPAYAVNSLLNRLPLLGDLLGGEGEGLIGLTFTVTGEAASPRITANPLSMLAPGALRRIFQGGPAEAPPPNLFDEEPRP